MPEQRTFAKFLEYLIVRGFELVLRILPYSLRLRFCEGLGLLAYRLSGRYRNLVLRHLKTAFPEKDDDWREKIARDNFRYSGRLIAEGSHTPVMNERFIKSQLLPRPDSEEHREIFRRGGIAILGHLGNWEWHGCVASRLGGRDIYTLVKRHTNFWSNAYLERTRNRVGMKLIYIDENPFKIIKLLRRGEFVAFTADQNARGHGEFFPFLGKPASTFLGPAVVARNTDVPVYFVWSHHDEQRRVIFEFEEIPRPAIDPADIESWEREFTYAWVKKLEEKVRAHPTDYLWAHNRWKTQPENPEQFMRNWNLPSNE